ncbi:MAG TPA: hypothetical protein DDW87_10310 [Firmicutes bacterium]|nr:hypothetical protein [Bacillota bacterium]
MKKQRLRKLEAMLKTDKEELSQVEARLAGPDSLGASMSGTTGELSTYDNHPADLGSEMYERSKDFGLLQTTRQQLAEIEEAQDAIREGSYGFCRNCGQAIPEKRLLALPGTLLCIRCKREQEDQDLNNRPVEEELLAPPFGRTFTDEEDSVIFDGEDAWEAVERYGTSSNGGQTPTPFRGSDPYDRS